MLQLQVSLENFLDRFADLQPTQQLEIRQSVEKENPLGQLVRMLHFVDRFVPLEFSQFRHAPIVEHAIMQPILVDRGKFVFQSFVEKLDDFYIALHGRFLLDNQ